MSPDLTRPSALRRIGLRDQDARPHNPRIGLTDHDMRPCQVRPDPEGRAVWSVVRHRGCHVISRRRFGRTCRLLCLFDGSGRGLEGQFDGVGLFAFGVGVQAGGDLIEDRDVGDGGQEAAAGTRSPVTTGRPPPVRSPARPGRRRRGGRAPRRPSICASGGRGSPVRGPSPGFELILPRSTSTTDPRSTMRATAVSSR